MKEHTEKRNKDKGNHKMKKKTYRNESPREREREEWKERGYRTCGLATLKHSYSLRNYVTNEDGRNAEQLARNLPSNNKMCRCAQLPPRDPTIET
jgi:hypothetical protein